MKFKKKITLYLTLFLIVIISGCKHEKTVGTISKTDFLMDTIISIKIYDNGDEALMDNLFERLRAIENKMSITIKTSDVSMINKNAGIKPVKVDPETYYVLERAKEYARLSDGSYDPTIGPLVDLWDFKSEEKERDTIPTKDRIKNTLHLIGYEKLELLDNNRVFLSEKDMIINLGSIVKGYAADEMKKILVENDVEAAIVDLGGNIYAYGNKKDGTPFRIGIQDPKEVTGKKIGVIEVKDKSIVTSGNYERYFVYNGKRYHHILDTTTGYPSENSLDGVSIISDQSIDGDALSTTLFTLDIEKGEKLLDSLEGIEAIFITKDNKIYISDKISKDFTLENKDYNLIIY